MQLQLFADHEKADIEALPRTCTTDINLANTRDLFQAILKRVGDSQQELSFLSLLQRLLKIDSGNELLSESSKQAIEQLVSKTTTLDSEEDAKKILNTIFRRIGTEDRNSSVFRLRKEISSDGDDIPPKDVKSSETVSVTQVKQDCSTMSTVPPPPPPPPGTLGGPPPPPPPPGSISPYASTAPSLPQINVPKPRSKMKTLQWQKIPVNNVIGKANIWTIISHLDKKYEMDYEKMDELFSLTHDAGSKRLSQDPDGASDSKKKRENMEVNILDGKRSLNVNIFLKQFRMEHKELVQLIREGRCEKFGAERLKSLLKLLPSQEEIDTLNAYSGDVDKLGNAEKFLLCLMKLPNYRMRVEGLLIMEEFNINMEWIRPSIEAVIQAARDIQENQSLKELIYLILISGNYLNSGNYAGNAAGFKLSSLLKLTEIRANNPRINLMHYVAQEAEMKNPRLLKFPEEMAFLKDASQVSIEALTTDISNIASKVRAITEQIVLAGADFQQQMAFFLKEANVEVTELEDDLNDIDSMRQELATFFCEDIKTFKLEECFRILQTFCERLRQATEENIQRRIQETKTDKRKSKEQPETQLYSKDFAEPVHQAIDRGSEHNKGSIVDMLLADVRSGFTSRKFNEGNFSVTKVTKVNLSPADMASPTTSTSPTPESAAQRRSRKSGDVDNGETLLEYLMETANSAAKPAKSESHLERYANLRKRRLERKAKQRVVKLAEMERESASSPSVADIKSSTPIGQSSFQSNVRQSKDGDRSKSESVADKKGSHTLRRTQSLLDRSSVEKANLERRSKDSKDDTDKSDALMRRLRQRLSKADGRNTPPISEEGEGMTGVAYNHSVIKNAESFENENLNGNDDLTPNVMVSMRKKISSGMGTDIDGILKTIEDTGRQIDTVGVTGPMKRTPDATAKGAATQPQVAMVAHVAAPDSSNMAMSEKDLKAKRDKRKKRSTLSLDDVKAAMKLSNDKTSHNYTSSSDHTNSSFPTSRNPTSPKQKSVNNNDKADNTKTVSGDNGNNKEFDKAAKLAAARKKFRGARFGVSGATDISSSNRARSNVEYESVDQALKEIACQSSMNRSKSYDEHVAKKLAVEGEFASNSIMKMNSSSAPGTSAEKRAVMRNSLTRLSMDGRRNGLYIPSDDSDTELRPEDIGTRRSSKSDSPKSFSQLSLKSTNTSTETLQSELEPSSEQSIRKAEPSSHSIPISNNTKSNTPHSTDFSTNATATAKLDSPLHRSYSLLERSKNILDESDSPIAAVAKWRIKRAQNRKSVYDNVKENNFSDSVSSTIHGHIYHSKLEENESKNDDGSRNSYASSNDRDEGFETASGTMSQRTSMSSNLEAEMYNTPTMSRRAEGQKSKGVAEGVSHIKSVITASKVNDSVLSRLSDEADRKERTENWTEQFVRINVNNESRSETDHEFNNALSPDSGLSTSKEDIWSENLAAASSKTGKSSSPVSRQKKLTAEEAAMPARPKAIPSYMLPTSSSSSKPDRSRLSTSTKADTAATVSPFRRDSNIRASTRNQEAASPFKRDNVRASMRAESATASFQRGTVARTSVRGPRSSISHSTPSPQSNLSHPSHGRARSDSTASVSSTTSSASNISATPSSVSEATRHRLDPVSNTRSSPHNRRPTTPSLHLTTPVHHPTRQTTSLSSSPPSRAVAPASHSKATTTPVSSGFSRSMSLRVTPTRTSLGNEVKHNTDNRRSIVLPSNDGRRSVTSFLNEKSPNTSPQLPERPRSTTPMSSDNTSSRRSSFMAPTASSRAKLDEQAPVAPPRTKSLRGASNTSPLTRSASLRVPARSTNGRESPVNAEQHYHHKPEYHQPLTTVTEQAGDEQKAEDHVKKSTSLLQRIGIGKSKSSSVASTKSPLTKK